MSRRSIPELAVEVVDAGLELVKTEIAIAREDLAKAVAAKAVGIALLLGAGLIGLIALVFLSVALFHALDASMSTPLAALVTALVILALAGVLAVVGLGRLKGEPDARE